HQHRAAARLARVPAAAFERRSAEGGAAVGAGRRLRVRVRLTMAGFRIPGPLCAAAQPWDVADGTTPPIMGVPPGPVCAASPLFREAAPFLPQSAADPSILFR